MRNGQGLREELGLRDRGPDTWLLFVGPFPALSQLGHATRASTLALRAESFSRGVPLVRPECAAAPGEDTIRKTPQGPVRTSEMNS